MTDVNATCPFYSYERTNTIHCQAVKMEFSDRKSKEKFKETFCCDFEGMKTCPIYAAQQGICEKVEKMKEGQVMGQAMKETCYFKDERKCRVTTRKDCVGCSFYKTKAEVMQGRLKAEKMLEALPESKRKALMEKYYGADYGEEQDD